MKLNKKLNKFYAYTEIALMIIPLICAFMMWFVPVSIAYYMFLIGMSCCIVGYTMAQIRLKKGLELFDFEEE